MAADGVSQREIATRLGINRRTVGRLAEADEPPHYERAPAGSMLDPFEPVIRKLIEEWPDIKAPRVTELLRDDYGYAGSVDLVRKRMAVSVRNRISRRDTVELCEQLFGSRISTATIDAILQRAADALSEPCEDLLVRVRGARAVNMDETGWRLRGGQRALWGAFSGRHAILRVEPDRHAERAKDLLADSTAIVTSDRWWAYSHLPLRRRQVCWSHLQRDFAFHAEGRGIEKQLGEHGLRICEEVFWAWEIFQHTVTRPRWESSSARCSSCAPTRDWSRSA